MKEITRAHKSLVKAHKLLVCQFLEIAASTEVLRHSLARIRELLNTARLAVFRLANKAMHG